MTPLTGELISETTWCRVFVGMNPYMFSSRHGGPSLTQTAGSWLSCWLTVSLTVGPHCLKSLLIFSGIIVRCVQLYTEQIEGSHLRITTCSSVLEVNESCEGIQVMYILKKSIYIYQLRELHQREYYYGCHNILRLNVIIAVSQPIGEKSNCISSHCWVQSVFRMKTDANLQQ